MSDSQINQFKLTVIYLFIVLFALAIIFRIVQLQLFQKERWSKAQETTLTYKKVKPNRGDILDAHGNILATSVPWYKVSIDLTVDSLKNYFEAKSREKRLQVDSLAICLAPFVGKPASVVKKDLIQRYKSKKQFFLKKEVSNVELKKISKFPILRDGTFKGGFVYHASNKRVKPYGELASRTIGKLDSEENGFLGIEKAYNKELGGTEGQSLMRKLPQGVWMPVGDANDVEPKYGADIYTTIDINFQEIVHNSLKSQLIKFDAEYGTAILMEVQTGEIKAIANLSDTLGDYHEVYNYAFGHEGCNEPGSTFKLASLIVALDNGYVDLSDIYDVGNGVKKYFGKEMRDSHKEANPKLTVKQIFEKSSNVGVSTIITNFYHSNPSKFVDRLYAMNLGNKLEIELPGEGIPKIKYPGEKTWWGTTLPWMSIGYEVQLTPLQILTFYNAIANDGRMIKPRFIKYLKIDNETIPTGETKIINPSICSYKTLQKAKEMLKGVVLEGTASNIKTDYLDIAGKTGTAKLPKGPKGYEGSRDYRASFVGYFPSSSPKYSCIVVISRPKGEIYTGNLVAGEVFKNIAERIYASSFDFPTHYKTNTTQLPITKKGSKKDIDNVLSQISVKPKNNSLDSEWIITQIAENNIHYKKMNISKKVVPDVIGMGAKDAVYILENLGLNVKLSGKGQVKVQLPDKGSSFKKGDNITLQLG